MFSMCGSLCRKKSKTTTTSETKDEEKISYTAEQVRQDLSASFEKEDENKVEKRKIGIVHPLNATTCLVEFKTIVPYIHKGPRDEAPLPEYLKLMNHQISVFKVTRTADGALNCVATENHKELKNIARVTVVGSSILMIPNNVSSKSRNIYVDFYDVSDFKLKGQKETGLTSAYDFQLFSIPSSSDLFLSYLISRDNKMTLKLCHSNGESYRELETLVDKMEVSPLMDTRYPFKSHEPYITPTGQVFYHSEKGLKVYDVNNRQSFDINSSKYFFFDSLSVAEKTELNDLFIQARDAARPRLV